MKPGNQTVVGEVMIDSERLSARVTELGSAISADYGSDDRDLVLVGVLRGAVVLNADHHLAIYDPCENDFMAVSSYGSSTHSTGVPVLMA